MDARVNADADRAERHAMIGHVAAKYDIKMDDKDPYFIIVDMNLMALESASRKMEARILNSVDERLNSFKPEISPAAGVAKKTMDGASIMTMGVAVILLLAAGISSGWMLYGKFGGNRPVTEQLGALNDVASMMRCTPMGGKVITGRPGYPGTWCEVPSPTLAKNGDMIYAPAWRIK